MKCVYLAAPWDMKDKAKEARKQFLDAGWTVTSRWIDYAGTAVATELELRQEAERDIRDIIRSNLLVLLNLQPRGSETSGKAVEMGFALAYGIPIIVVGEWSNVFHFLPEVTMVHTVEEAIKEANHHADM